MKNFFSLLGLFLFTSSLLLADTLVTPTYYTGTRSTTSGLIGAGTYASSSAGMQLTWTITSPGQNGSAYYHYVYNFKNANGTALSTSIQDFYVQVSTAYYTAYNSGKNYIINSSASLSAPQTINGQYYVDFSNVGSTLSFNTILAPSWQSIAAYNSNTANNVNNASSGQAVIGTNYTNWVPTPGNTFAVPEPSMLLLLSTCCSLILGLHFTKQLGLFVKKA